MASTVQSDPARQPRVLILGTGGTIAGEADPRSPIGYRSGAASIADLVAGAPGIETLAALEAEQIAAVGSQDINESVWFALRARIRVAEASGAADAVVITHGTDTMEETAFFLDLTAAGGIPVILTGAMRHAGALGADGPANLHRAVKVAADPQSVGRGVLVVANDTIHAARRVAKRHTTDVCAFRSSPDGPVGYVNGSAVGFYAPRAPIREEDGFAMVEPPLPRVDIVYAHAGMDTAIIAASLAAGARGVVLAGVGGGNASDTTISALGAAARDGILVVRASRCGEGLVSRNVEVDDDALGFVATGALGPPKARILAQLLIAAGISDPAQAQQAFDGV